MSLPLRRGGPWATDGLCPGGTGPKQQHSRVEVAVPRKCTCNLCDMASADQLRALQAEQMLRGAWCPTLSLAIDRLDLAVGTPGP